MTEEEKSLPVWGEIPQYEEMPIEEFQGDKISIDNVLNKGIAILEFRVLPSAFFEGNYLMVQIMDPEGNLAWFTTGSSVLEKQLNELKKKEKLPIRCKIVKIKRYYTLAK